MIKQAAHYLYQKVSYLLSPPVCTFCKISLSQRSVLCVACQNHLDPIVSVQLPLSATRSMTICAVSHYKEPLKSLIVAKRYSSHVASKQLAQLMWQHTALRYLAFDYLIPIPLHWMRYAQRGYNQAEVIAYELGRLSGKQVLPLLRRVRRTDFQSEIPVDDRRMNVLSAFELTRDARVLKGKHVVLVDDLMTTGATLQEAGKVLMRLQPAQVSAVVACRVV